MTESLQDAFKVAESLPDEEQVALAAAILEEVAFNKQHRTVIVKQHRTAIVEGESALEGLADEALEDHRAGRTETLDPDRH